MGRMHKKTPVAYLMFYTTICYEHVNNTTKNRRSCSRNSAEIRDIPLRNRSAKTDQLIQRGQDLKRKREVLILNITLFYK
jgi:hypothetical protein